MRLHLVVFLSLLAAAGAATVNAYSGGPPPETVKSSDGCVCHGDGQPNSATVVTVTGFPTTYEPGASYKVEVTSTTDVPAPPTEQNQGGFLAYVSKGDILTEPGPAWYLLGQMDGNKEAWISHSKQGETENVGQKWTFNWTAPAEGSGDVVLHVYVNRVNSNGSPDGGDHWNRKSITSKESGSGTPSPPVEPPTNTITTTTSDTSPPNPPAAPPAAGGTTRDGGTPGIGLVASLVALASGLVVARRLR